MSYDFKASAWKRDANSFQRYLDLFNSFTSVTAKRQCIKALESIQSRWPQFIKASEVPTLEL